MSAPWQPLYDKILVRREKAIEERRGLAVADAYQEKQNRGTVIAVGMGRWINGALYPLTLEVGDEVMFSKFAGVDVDAENEPDVVILREDEVMVFRKVVPKAPEG